ncbi:NAD(P)-dependent oxidoreductase [bacterium]|nr:MAG: NAD(P)-dependent oxidoreductase [bacterium]
METFAPEALFHLAALVRVEDERAQAGEVIRSNIELGCQLIEWGAPNGLKYVVNTGSFWEERGEEGLYDPVDLYAASKRAFGDLLAYLAPAHGLRAITLRPFGTFGPEDGRANLFSLLDRAAISGEEVSLTAGEQVFELVYASDAAEGYLKALETLERAEAPGVLPPVELGTGEALTLREFVALYERVRGVSLKIKWGARPYREREVMGRSANVEKTFLSIGWRPAYGVERGLREIFGQAK